MERGGTGAFPAGGLIALASLAQDRNFRLVLLKIGFMLDGMQ